MCTRTIIDASVFNILKKKEITPWRRWINDGNGVLVYSTKGKYWDELIKNSTAIGFLSSIRSYRSAILIADEKLEQAKNNFEGVQIKSNDRHVLELALASGTLVLFSNDRNLNKDFKELIPINQMQRAVYPHKASRKKRESFLDERKCKKNFN